MFAFDCYDEKVKNVTEEVLYGFIGEPNDSITRNKIVHKLASLLNVSERHVRCNEENNPPSTVERNAVEVSVQFNDKIYNFTLEPN